MMKTVMMFLAFVSVFSLYACGNSKEKPAVEAKVEKQAISEQGIIGEWQCVDITNGVTHMESIARMQPHLVFNAKHEIRARMKLPDGTFVDQKISSYSIKNGTISSKNYEVSPYMEGGKLVIEDPSTDSRRIYRKVGN